MNTLKKWILVVLMSFCASSFANTFTADLSDLWFNTNESGWGVNVTHQREIIFLTFFIYGTDGRASWYTGQASFQGENTQGALVFNGDMFQFTGPYFGNFFNTTQVNGRKVGSVTFTAFLDLATLSYSIDGVTVNKVVTRQTFRNNDLSGQYTGAIKRSQSQCRPPQVNGEVNNATEFSVTHSATSFSMTVRQPDSTVCTYFGSYTQNGRLGRSQGNFNCPTGEQGTYDAFELEANLQGFLGRYTATSNYCDTTTGRFAAMRK